MRLIFLFLSAKKTPKARISADRKPMEQNKVSKHPKKEKEPSESPVALFYDFIQNLMRPSPKHPTYVQVLLFIVKLPVLLIILTLSPILFLFMFITFVVAL